ncbi:tail fiber assembly protein [Erwinia persicina]|uniref:tail fiber assembly protein n=1 Tax=Erwinia persicina TaxID=55211 RepID=UPI0016541E5F|nr:tail fiber assembly protein [Erwinia persicina]MBC3946680.1 tail fiber assembly protein [Erwinia persicina]
MKKLGKFTEYTPDINPFLEDIVYSEINRVESVKAARLAELKRASGGAKLSADDASAAIQSCDEILRESLESVDTDTLSRVLFFRNEKGEDWYSLLPSLASNNIKIVYDDDGLICSMSRDPQCLVPSGLSVAVLAPSEVPELLEDELAADGPDLLQRWQVIGKKVTLSPAFFQKKRDQMVRAISARTMTWQTQLLLGVISEEDKAALTRCMVYMQALQALDLSAGDDIEWPEVPYVA